MRIFFSDVAVKLAGADTWEYPGEPVDGFNAEGHYGQKLIVIPSRRIVVARLGNDRAPEFDPNTMIAAVVDAVDAALGRAGKGGP